MRMMINKSKSSSFSCCFEGGKWQLVAKSGRTWLAWVWHCSLHAAPPLPFSALFMSTRANRCSHKWWCSQAASKSNWWSASNDLGHWGRRRQKSWFEQNTPVELLPPTQQGQEGVMPTLAGPEGVVSWTTQWSCHELMKSTCLGNGLRVHGKHPPDSFFHFLSFLSFLFISFWVFEIFLKNHRPH